MSIPDEKNIEDSNSDTGGSFVGFILLDSLEFDAVRLADNLRDEWGIAIPKADVKPVENSIVTQINGMTSAISLMPAPVPNGEAVMNARTNFRWPQAVNAAEQHVAHLLVAVLRWDESPPYQAGRLFVKLCAACSRLPNTTGINVLGSVLEPDSYYDSAKIYKQTGEFPVFNLVFFGLYSKDGGNTCCAYTFGMNAFCKKELEVVDSGQTPNEVFGFLHDIALYVLENDVTLKSGETIGFTVEQKIPITESPGAAIGGVTLKIGF